MKKNIFITAAALLAWSTAVCGQTAELPYMQEFSSNMGDVTIVNADENSPAFAYTPYYGYNYGGGAVYTGNAAYAADEYMITPVLSLEAGKVYTLSVLCKNSASGLPFNIEFVGGSSADALDKVLVPSQVINQGYDFSAVTGKFKSETDGVYYIAVHLTAEAGSGSFYLDNFGVSAGVSALAPSEMTNFTATPCVKDGAFVVDMTAKAPVYDFSGSALGGTVTVKAVRGDGKEVYTADGVTAGADIAFVDVEPLATYTKYTLTAVNDYGESPKVEATVSPVFSAPLPVENLKVVNNGNNVSLTWDASTEAASTTGIFIPAEVRYTVQRNMGANKTIVVDNLVETSYADELELPEQGQEAVSYTVTAKYLNKTAAPVVSETMLMGNAYKGEYAESFTKYSFQTKTWVADNGGWGTAVSSSYNPACDPQDGDNGMLKCQNATTENMQIASPYINVSMMKNPRLDFYVYQDNTMSYTNAVEVKLRSDGNDVSLGEPIAVNGAEAGWHKYSYFIPENVRKGDFRIVFDALPGSYASICVDNISIKDILDRNMALVALDVPARAAIGEEIQLCANVMNKGALEAAAYSVDFFVDDKPADSVRGEAVASDAAAAVSLPYLITPVMAEKTLKVKAVVAYDGDEAEIDDAQTATVEVGTNSYPVPQDLQAELTDGEVTLSWQRPEISGETEETEVNEDFESWTSGSYQPEQGWIFVDADRQKSNGFNGVNSGVCMAAMILEDVPYFTAHSGTKALGVSKMESYRIAPDEWMISPEVTGGQTIKFYAAAYSSFGYPYSTEKFTVCYSEGGTAPEDFIPIGDTYDVKSKNWTEYTVDLPVTATRFALHVTEIGDDGLLFDDFSFVKGVKPLELKKFNVYRDGELLSAVDAETTTCKDAGLEEGKTYTYTVSAVYDRGESLFSESATVETAVRPDNNLSVLSLNVAETADIGETLLLEANVKNNGKLDAAAGAYKVNFLVDGNVVSSTENVALAADAEKTFSGSYLITPDMAGKTLKVEAVVEFEADEDKADNKLETAVEILANTLPVPAAVKAEMADAAVSVTWQQPEMSADNDALVLKGYNVYRDGVKVEAVDAETLTFMDEKVEEGKTYAYTVTAVYESGESVFSESAEIEVPVRCYNNLTLLSLDVAETADIGEPLSIGANIKNMGKLTAIMGAYSVEFYVNDKLVDNAIGFELAPFGELTLAVPYLITPDMAGKTLDIKAVIVYSTDEDMTDNTLETTVKVLTNTLPVPVALKTDIADRAVNVTWQRPEISADNETLELKGYNVYRNGVKIAATNAETLTFTDEDVEENETYTYTVTAVYDGGESMFSAPVEITIIYTSITGVTGSAKSVTAVDGGIKLDVADNTRVRVYNAAGKEVYAAVVSNTVNISLPAGVYIVKAGAETVKIAVK